MLVRKVTRCRPEGPPMNFQDRASATLSVRLLKTFKKTIEAPPERRIGEVRPILEAAGRKS